MKKNVLLVDDNQQMLDELRDIFKDNKINLLAADSGKEALKLAEKEDFDVAVVDIRLPDFNGVELIDKLKNVRPNSIYLLITAYTSAETAIKALQKGVLDYIVKPFSPEELINSVKKGFMEKDAAEASEKRLEELVKEKGLLQAKVMMLEQLNEIFMDREKKILDLKKEVNELLLRLNENTKYVL